MSAHRLLFLAAIAAFYSTNPWQSIAQSPRTPQTILFGAAYYEEYAPSDRLDEDVRMMKATGITVVRIAESTWGTLEPKPGVFDFSHVDRVLAAMDKAGIKVIVGTPTYAIPTWLARQHPDVLVVTPKGPAEYGRRQNMDITNPEFRTLRSGSSSLWSTMSRIIPPSSAISWTMRPRRTTPAAPRCRPPLCSGCDSATLISPP